KRYQSARDMQADLEKFIREERIAASTVSLSTWMNFLFEDKIAQQKLVLQDVKQLADVIATQHSDPGDWMKETGTVGAATITQTDFQELTQFKKRQTRMFAALGLVVLALAGVGGVVAMKLQAQQAQKTAAAAAPEPEKKHGKLTVTTNPPGAYVRIAG